MRGACIWVQFRPHSLFIAMVLLYHVAPATAKQTNKQTHTHMGIQTPYYHHIADAAWFGLYFSRCHSNGKPGSKSEYPLWCSTPPYGKINDSVESQVCLPYLSFPTPVQQRPSRDLSYACQTPRRSQASSPGDEGTPAIPLISSSSCYVSHGG